MCFGCNRPRKHTTNHTQLPWRSLRRARAFFRLVSKKVAPRSIARAFLSIMCARAFNHPTAHQQKSGRQRASTNFECHCGPLRPSPAMAGCTALRHTYPARLAQQTPSCTRHTRRNSPLNCLSGRVPAPSFFSLPRSPMRTHLAGPRRESASLARSDRRPHPRVVDSVTSTSRAQLDQLGPETAVAVRR